MSTTASTKRVAVDRVPEMVAESLRPSKPEPKDVRMVTLMRRSELDGIEGLAEAWGVPRAHLVRHALRLFVRAAHESGAVDE